MLSLGTARVPTHTNPSLGTSMAIWPQMHEEIAGMGGTDKDLDSAGPLKAHRDLDNDGHRDE